MQSCLEPIPDDIKRVFVAYSGGLDSSVLLQLAVISRRDFELVPWHVNHGMVDQADRMEQFCIEQAARYGLEIRVDRLDLSGVESNIEAEARSRRYRLFETRTRAGDCILTAHHADDQAETFLLNALRGSGCAGLRGIAARRMLGDALLLRPLLKFERSRLEAHAQAHEIPWFNDPSNQDDRFDRNYLRNRVVPLIRKRWPDYQNGLAMSSEIQAETQQLLDEVAARDFTDLRRDECGGFATIDVDGLLDLSPARRKNLIRHWIAGAGLAMLPHARLRELLRQLQAKPGALPEIAMADYSVRLYDKRLFLVRSEDCRECHGSFDFGLNRNIAIEQLGLRLSRAEVFRRLAVDDREQALTLKFRHAGEQNSDRHRLKRIFQKHRVPPWRRSSVAQVYLDGQLAGLLL
jgi:tRNA(Ile)-lysidine synthase